MSTRDSSTDAMGREPVEPGGAKPFRFVGGDPALDFVNTVDWLEPPGDRAPEPGTRWRELIRDYGALVRWAREGRLLSDAEAESLLEGAARHPYRAREALARALDLRAAVRAVVTAAAAGEAPQAWSRAIFGEMLASALCHRTVTLSGEGAPAWGWTMERHEPALDRVAWEVAWAAAALLTSPELPRVRTCAGESCGWMYVDRSRNHRRRWCEMSVCGNRAKARRHYARRSGRQ